ncbi:unnamed protein product [Heligmosomoides polygyrus]|uniref:Uncharacterized protein n=1 Tax=Heligmosomoides polygyrus TaxID=6339 RepID=A0A183GEX1_HELPZ|nr:unnamed protein product [Heligmosomoides polygyrus]
MEPEQNSCVKRFYGRLRRSAPANLVAGTHARIVTSDEQIRAASKVIICTWRTAEHGRNSDEAHVLPVSPLLPVVSEIRVGLLRFDDYYIRLGNSYRQMRAQRAFLAKGLTEKAT